ncbi:MFS transporter [Kitasatospora arboriphila]|uniref:MFS transporter n=1 Tax=Kitasatospora arboriphila TaxID=258052 RepID=A0ABN1TGR5_9ACTN
MVLAVACWPTAANLHYAQPLLEPVARSFGVGQGAAATVVTLTQAGYALGLLFVVPLGGAPGPTGQRGRVVGRVMSGLLTGILPARTVASLGADLFGRRANYVISAVLMLALGVVLRRLLPRRAPDHTAGYVALLAGLGGLVRREPVLRRRAVCQATMCGAFTTFWTAIAYELIEEHHFGQVQIVLFALVGAGGAAAAPVAGRIADRGHGRSAVGAALLLAPGASVLAALGHGSVLLLALAAVLLDFAVQCHQVLSQHEIYALRGEARARINTIFMTTVFAGGAVSSAVAGALHTTHGWTSVCAFGTALPLAGLMVWAHGQWTARTRASADAVPRPRP